MEDVTVYRLFGACTGMFVEAKRYELPNGFIGIV